MMGSEALLMYLPGMVAGLSFIILVNHPIRTTSFLGIVSVWFSGILLTLYIVTVATDSWSRFAAPMILTGAELFSALFILALIGAYSAGKADRE
jgi:hypothetical protein